MAHRGSSGPRYSSYFSGSQSCAFVISTQDWPFSRTDALRAGLVSGLKNPSILLIIPSIEFL
jgi:hypothetical protein